MAKKTKKKKLPRKDVKSGEKARNSAREQATTPKFFTHDTFSESVCEFVGNEQKAINEKALVLRKNPSNPGLKFHKVDKSKDENFRSVRVNRDIRIIIWQDSGSFHLCYVGRHKDAYTWAENRKLDINSSTGAAQMVVIPERVIEVETIKRRQYVGEEISRQVDFKTSNPFVNVPDQELMSYGIPEANLASLRRANSDNEILKISDDLPEEAAEAVFSMWTGETPQAPLRKYEDPYENPDARRRFYLVESKEALERALEYPWEKWMIFLHPAQRSIIEKTYSGPAKVSGPAGTGKTVVALHRAVHLARKHENAKVLLATFSSPLANLLRRLLKYLAGNEPGISKRIHIQSVRKIGRDLHQEVFGRTVVATKAEIKKLLRRASSDVENVNFDLDFLWMEWDKVIDDWQLNSWEDYKNVERMGRKTRLSVKQRSVVWPIFERVRAELRDENLLTDAVIFERLAKHYASTEDRPYEFIIVDEAQDISMSELRFFAGLGGDRPEGLFFAGDLGQRIFRLPFSWKSLGVDVHGRSTMLKVNYRTSHQIRAMAEKLLDSQLVDADGNVEDRRGTVSAFSGPDPVVRFLNSEDEERNCVAKHLREWADQGIDFEKIAVFVRSEDQVQRAEAAVSQAGVPYRVLGKTTAVPKGRLSIITMDLAKGLEFSAVVVMACDKGIVPLQKRLDEAADKADLEEIYRAEKQLLYVAATRARDRLLVTGVAPGSEFLSTTREQ